MHQAEYLAQAVASLFKQRAEHQLLGRAVRAPESSFAQVRKCSLLLILNLQK
jgi:hypothetical protein